jgi:hypothetical protein
MTEETSDKGTAVPELPMWLRATLEDIEGFDFEAPLADSAATKSRLLFEPYHAAMKEAEARQDGRAARVFCMLAAVTNMQLRPRDKHEPFGPMAVMSNGNRSATPADFRGHVEQLSNMALRAVNPVLRSRLADVTWVLDRKRAAAATAAISSYVEIVNGIKRDEPEEREEHDFGVLRLDVQDYMRRALQIGRAIGWDKPETLAARGLGIELRELAFRRRKAAPIYWFSYLDLDFDLSSSDRVSEELEAHLAGPGRTK